MEELTIVFGTAEDGSFWKQHFGDSKQFIKYHLFSDREPELVGVVGVKRKEERVDVSHDSAGKLSKVIERLGSCDCVAAYQMSPNFRRMAADTELQPVVVKAETREQLLRLLQDNFGLLLSLSKSRKNGAREKAVPTISAAPPATD